MSGWRKPAQDIRKAVKASTSAILQQKIDTYKVGGWEQISEVRMIEGKPTVMMKLANRKGA